MPVTLAQIYRYPVKGLSPESLAGTMLARASGLPHDRRFALAHAAAKFDPAAPTWLAKTNFLMLMRNERLALLRTRFDEASDVLTISRDGITVVDAKISEASGRAVIENFFASYMRDETSGRPRLLEAPSHMFSDVARKVVSIIGLASVRDLERVMGHTVDPRRFRANFYVEGSAPWAEFDWVGHEFHIGTARLRGVKPISRCAATNVDPESAVRDLNIPRALQEHFRHVNTGIYAEILEGGPVALGDRLEPQD
jgi:hypothetical protein